MPTTNITTIRILRNLNIVTRSKTENPELDERRQNIYNELLNYYDRKNRCIRGISRLKAILQKEPTLDQRNIREWTVNHQQLGQKELFGFYFEYLDYGDDPNRDLYIPALALYVDRTDFIPIIQFWEIHYFLYGNQYHLEASEREIADPNEYYYNPPDPNAPPDLDIVIALLNEDFSVT